MANWNPLTNASGGGGATGQNQYYNINPTNFGEYGFIYLTEVVENFIATYTGTGKILPNTLGADVNFHAHRALQELSYDTLVSSKSQEIEVCPSLKMPLPHDYVNYVKLTSVDNNGIEHVLYPARNTSNPFSISQSDGCGYDMDSGKLKHQSTCIASTITECSSETLNAWFQTFFGSNSVNYRLPSAFPLVVTENEHGTHDAVTFTSSEELYMYIAQLIDDYCECANNHTGDPSFSCGNSIGWQFYEYIPNNVLPEWKWGLPLRGGWDSGLFSASGLPIFSEHIMTLNNITTGGLKIASGYVDAFLNGLSETIPNLEGSFGETCTFFSNTWDSYSTSSGTSVGVTNTLDPGTDNSNYFTNTGERYGLDPQRAQVNGSYFIDHLRGNIHFSSALAGKTIILKYISDGHGTEDEMMIPKLAEEAMYKWIAYGCAQARADIDPNIVARLKKERAAETRKAKLRLSNIKLEEISQVFRGKSKWIKH
jgi:hypothetical protein